MSEALNVADYEPWPPRSCPQPADVTRAHVGPAARD
jgi:hypothetical protein